MKQAKLFSELLQAQKRELLTDQGFEQRGPEFSVSSVPHCGRRRGSGVTLEKTKERSVLFNYFTKAREQRMEVVCSYPNQPTFE